VKALAAAILAMLSFGAAAQAAELPKPFHGLWVAAEVPNKDKCRKEEPKGEDDRPVDSMMSVDTGGTISYYEHQCKIKSARMQHAIPPDDKTRITMDVSLTCKGEGMLWSAREIWHVETIDERKVTVVTAFDLTNYRSEKGKREKVENRITTSIYYPCK
jgi:hypothetical protein